MGLSRSTTSNQPIDPAQQPGVVSPEGDSGAVHMAVVAADGVKLPVCGARVLAASPATEELGWLFSAGIARDQAALRALSLGLSTSSLSGIGA